MGNLHWRFCRYVYVSFCSSCSAAVQQPSVLFKDIYCADGRTRDVDAPYSRLSLCGFGQLHWAGAPVHFAAVVNRAHNAICQCTVDL